jgi:flagellar biogenesis protein FliO
MSARWCRWLACAALALAWPALAADEPSKPLPPVGAFASPTAMPLARMGAGLGVTLTLAAAAAWWSRRRRGPGGSDDARIQVMARRGLGPRHQLAVVEVSGRRLLVGMAGDTIQTLADLSEEVASFPRTLERELPAREALARGGLLHSIGRFEGLDG